MGGARALIASLGASISLVAGAALSLLAVSLLFAYGGWSDSMDSPNEHAAVEVSGRTHPAPVTAGRSNAAAPVVIRVQPAAPPARPAVKRPAPTGGASGNAGAKVVQPSFSPRVGDLGPSAVKVAPARPAAPKPQTGDGVRQLGDAVSATVKDTGDAAGAATAPLLGPPVSQAVQDVLNMISALLKRATATLAGTLDTALPAK